MCGGDRVHGELEGKRFVGRITQDRGASKVEFGRSRRTLCVMSCGSKMQPSARIQHPRPWSPLLVYTSLKLPQRRGKNGFRTKAAVSASTRGCRSIYRRPRLLSKKTDSCSLSTRFCVMIPIIYLVAAMATVGAAWCMGFLNALTAPFSVMTHPALLQDSALHENPGVKRTGATIAKQGSAWRFEVLFIGRLSTAEGEKKKDRLEIYLTVSDTLCKQRKSVQ